MLLYMCKKEEVKIMMSKEMLKVVEILEKKHGCEGACDHCPFAQECEEKEMWWGCPVWEDQMGEDL